ncbi:MAG: DUF4358 domain-containing protein [Oscillospiraceae bacterium]|jgi:hypothetical protein|nr:DUF4358 domain-containing protein [Oscillospiraceae bacterium]
MKKILLPALLMAAWLLMVGAATEATPVPALILAPDLAVDTSCLAVAQAVAAGQTFAPLTPQEPEEVYAFVNLEEEAVADLAFWLDATAWTPEMILAVTATNEETMERLRDQVQAFWDYLTEQYRDYASAELPKLENAVFCTRGLQVVFVVSPDAALAEAALGKDFIKIAPSPNAF